MEELIQKVIQGVLKQSGSHLGDEVAVSVTLVDNPTIHELNREHRNVDRPTDVLSFSQLEGEEMPALPPGEALPLGDLVISLERCKEQAEEYGHSFERELGFLVAHGTLHLLGYDHQTPEEEAEMMAKTEAVLAELGLSRP
jgi:probable rRNA maturation factor